ncbi:hypothetical protein [Bradyrhizobium sp. Tv2a-2]|uniref:hypothetical protein n=1 Tax=Bradyrhizobium sp. Tv2a-2 TaxID=113395 RepID=UPI000411A86F|nr:hypothetical protein [Bradyrhizobium sp. Tv2a-2]
MIDYRVGDRVRYDGDRIGTVTRVDHWTHTVRIDDQFWLFYGQVEKLTYPFDLGQRVRFQTVQAAATGKITHLFTTNGSRQYAIVEDDHVSLPHLCPLSDVEALPA